jgi:hypothetical protein
MRVFINNTPLSAHYDKSSRSSRIYSGCLLRLGLMPVLLSYLVDLVAPIPSVRDPFRSDILVQPTDTLSRESDLVLGQDWHFI